MDEADEQRKRARRRSREEIGRLVSEFEGGEQSREEFARKCGIAESTLGNWLRRHGRRDSEPQDWIEIPASPPPSGGADYEVIWPGGMVLRVGRGFDAREVVQLVKLIGEPCSR